MELCGGLNASGICHFNGLVGRISSDRNPRSRWTRRATRNDTRPPEVSKELLAPLTRAKCQRLPSIHPPRLPDSTISHQWSGCFKDTRTIILMVAVAGSSYRRKDAPAWLCSLNLSFRKPPSNESSFSSP